MQDQQQKELFQATFSFCLEKFENRKNDEGPFSEKGVESFAQFAWKVGRKLAQMRRSLGWDSVHVKELAHALNEALGEKSTLRASDLFHFCDYYLGCERLSKSLWKPVESTDEFKEKALE